MQYRFEIYKDNRGEYRWRFWAPNNQIIAVSGEGYTTKQSCQHSIGLVKQYAPTAPVIDSTVPATYAY
ncbi:MAG TPA: DUF1508 domain-containing protein [Thermoanaerobaculia bacterium]|jgi:hypothetical protein